MWIINFVVLALAVPLRAVPNSACIKWVAIFSKNVLKNKPRAHSIVILNDTSTGEPIAIIDTGLLSVIRKAAVSDTMLKQFLHARESKKLNIGIIGLGPIGECHYHMCTQAFSQSIDKCG